MNTFSSGVSVVLKHEEHSVLTEKKYKYVIAEGAEVKTVRKQRDEIWAYSEASLFL